MKLKKSFVINVSKWIVIGALELAVTGCLATRDEIREGVKAEPPTQEQQSIANNNVRYQELEEQTRKMMGRIETLENSMNILGADKTGTRSEQVAAKKATDEKLKILEDAVTKLENENVVLLQKLEALKTSQVSADSSAKEAKAAASKKSPFEQAEGEYQKRKWKESIVLYQKYRDTSPTGRHYAEASYKIGSAFHELGMKAEAKSFYAEVAEKFPRSEWAKKAAAKLKILK